MSDPKAAPDLLIPVAPGMPNPKSDPAVGLVGALQTDSVGGRLAAATQATAAGRWIAGKLQYAPGLGWAQQRQWLVIPKVSPSAQVGVEFDEPEPRPQPSSAPAPAARTPPLDVPANLDLGRWPGAARGPNGSWLDGVVPDEPLRLPLPGDQNLLVAAGDDLPRSLQQLLADDAALATRRDDALAGCSAFGTDAPLADAGGDDTLAAADPVDPEDPSTWFPGPPPDGFTDTWVFATSAPAGLDAPPGDLPLDGPAADDPIRLLDPDVWDPASLPEPYPYDPDDDGMIHLSPTGHPLPPDVPLGEDPGPLDDDIRWFEQDGLLPSGFPAPPDVPLGEDPPPAEAPPAAPDWTIPAGSHVFIGPDGKYYFDPTPDGAMPVEPRPAFVDPATGEVTVDGQVVETLAPGPPIVDGPVDPVDPVPPPQQRTIDLPLGEDPPAPVTDDSTPHTVERGHESDAPHVDTPTDEEKANWERAGADETPPHVSIVDDLSHDNQWVDMGDGSTQHTEATPPADVPAAPPAQSAASAPPPSGPPANAPAQPPTDPSGQASPSLTWDPKTNQWMDAKTGLVYNNLAKTWYDPVTKQNYRVGDEQIRDPSGQVVVQPVAPPSTLDNVMTYVKAAAAEPWAANTAKAMQEFGDGMQQGADKLAETIVAAPDKVNDFIAQTQQLVNGMDLDQLKGMLQTGYSEWGLKTAVDYYSNPGTNFTQDMKSLGDDLSQKISDNADYYAAHPDELRKELANFSGKMAFNALAAKGAELGIGGAMQTVSVVAGDAEGATAIGGTAATSETGAAVESSASGETVAAGEGTTASEAGGATGASAPEPPAAPPAETPSTMNDRPWHEVPVDPNETPGTRLPYQDYLDDPTDPPIDPATGRPLPEGGQVEPSSGASAPEPPAAPPAEAPSTMNDRPWHEVPVDPNETPGTRLPYQDYLDDPTDPPIDPVTGRPLPEGADVEPPPEPVSAKGETAQLDPAEPKAPGAGDSTRVEPAAPPKTMNDQPLSRVPVDPNETPGTRLPRHDPYLEDPTDPPIDPVTGRPLPEGTDVETPAGSSSAEPPTQHYEPGEAPDSSSGTPTRRLDPDATHTDLPMNDRPLARVPVNPHEAPGTRLPDADYLDDPTDPPIDPATGKPLPEDE